MLDAPEIHGVADAKVSGRTAAAAGSDATGQTIHRPTQLPQEISVEPSTVAAEARVYGRDLGGQRPSLSLAAVDEHPLREPRELAGQRSNVVGVEPRRLFGRGRTVERDAQGFIVAGRDDFREGASRCVVLDDHFIGQALDERPCDAGRNRRDQVDPIR